MEVLSSFTVGKDSLTTLPKFVLTSGSSPPLSFADLPALKSVLIGDRSLNEATFELSNASVEGLTIHENAFPHVTSLTLNRVNMASLTFEEAALQNLQSMTLESWLAHFASP